MQIEKIKPMLAELGTKDDLKRLGFIFEPKLDGTRVIVYVVDKALRILNENGAWIEYKYPELYNIWATIRANSCILDCALVVFNKKTKKPAPDLLVQRENTGTKLRIDILRKKIPATLVVLDILEKDGEDLKGKPLYERKSVLEQTVIDSAWLRKIFWAQTSEGVLKAAAKAGISGIIAKEIYSPYIAGKRSNLWLEIETHEKSKN